MNPLREYLAYIRHNPEHYWFKRKLWGWGWTPATKEGWAVLVVFFGLFIGNFYRIDSVSHSASDTLRPFLFQTVLLVLLLILICYKTGEPPKWQWGIPPEERK